MDECSTAFPVHDSGNSDTADSTDSALPSCSKMPSSESKMQPQTRHTTQMFGLGSAVCSDDAILTGSRLPTCLQVLRCMMYHCNMAANSERPGAVGAPSRFTTAKLVLQQITKFYQKANIPMVSERRACEKIVKLLDDNNKLRAISKKRRDTPATLQKLEENQRMLDSTFALWPPDAETLIKNSEDLAFLHSMKGNRAASFGSFDKVLAQKIARRDRCDRAAAERLKRARSEHDMQTSTSTISSELLTDSSDSEGHVAEHLDTSDSDKADGDIPDTAKHAANSVRPRRKKVTGTNVFIPPNVLSRPNVVSLATRLKMTPMQQAAFTQGLIAESGGDVSMVAASYATADRSRRKVAGNIAAKIRDDWIPPKLCTLHWDGKLTATLENHLLTEERLTVVVGDASELKLLGVPSYKKATDQATGAIIAELTMKLMTEWKCSDRIVNMTFDTTSANTGHLSAACIAIQEKLQRAVLWSGCRHHIGEVLLSHVFNDLKIEASKSPDITVFTRLRSNWDLLPHSSEQSLLFQPSSHSPKAQEILATMRNETIACATKVTEFLRDDYREFAELSLLFLGAPLEVHFRRPGALHKARWMAKLVYSLKLALAENSIGQLPPGTITSRQQVPKIRAFATFITHVYCMWWLTCTKTADAPWNDLQLFKRLLQYQSVDKNIAQSATRALSRHLWYLTAEMVPLALFSSQVPLAERQALADALLSVQPASELTAPQNRFGSGWGKPHFPSEISLSTRLCDLVGVDSWFTIARLQIDSTFLQLPVDEWEATAAYVTSAENVAAVNVVNDCAERGVKLASDFVDTARSDEHFQNILQVVEHDRKKKPNLRIGDSKSQTQN